MRTLSKQETQKRISGIPAFQTKQEEPGYFQRVGQSLKKTATGLGQDLQKQSEVIANEELNNPTVQGMTNKGLALGRGALRTVGAFAKGVVTPIMEAPGIKQATEFAGEKLAETTPVQKYAQWAEKHPDAAKDIENVLDVAGLFGGKQALPLAKNVGKVGKVGEELATGVEQSLVKVGEEFATATKNTPSEIMTRVARLTPREEVAFRNTAGKSVGEYLVERGNFGTPEEIVAAEARNFAQSKQMADDALSRLPGEYKVKQVDDALNLVIERAGLESTPNVKAPYLNRATQLLRKHQTQGLNMSEINEVKRLLESKVRLGYNKIMDSGKVKAATHVDSAIREWQFKKAPELGLENLPEINKQTQISKFILDKLGDSIVGKQALRNISLTDWIVLGGGDPTAVGGFLTKKFFSSKAVQAKVAKMLSQTEPKPIPTPRIAPLPEYLKRKALPAPKETAPGVYPTTGESVIQQSQKIPTSFEPQATNATTTRINPKTGDMYIRDLKTGKLKIVPKSTKQQ